MLFGAKLRNVAIFGDFLLLFLFPFLGGASHDNATGIGGFIRTFVPFAVAWIVVGAVTGAFTLSTIRSFRRTYRRVPIALIVSGIIAILIRNFVFDRPFIFTFTLVAIAVTTLLISGWRLLLASVPGR